MHFCYIFIRKLQIILTMSNSHYYITSKHMLRTIFRQFQTFSTNVNQPFLYQPFSRPSETKWLQNKFQNNHAMRENLAYLNELKQKSGLSDHFKSKNINEFESWECYFILKNRSLFLHMNQTKRKQILHNKRLDPYFKCYLAKELNFLDDVDFQHSLIETFNQNLQTMQVFQIIYCLESFKEFQVSRTMLDLVQIESKINKIIKEESDYDACIKISGYLIQMNIKMEKTINIENFHFWRKNIKNYDFRVIFFTFKLSEYFKTPLLEKEREIIDRKVHSALLKQENSQFEDDYAIFVIDYYPKHLNLLAKASFNLKAYIGYLQYFSRNPDKKIPAHNIENHLMKYCTYQNFQTIITLRLNLALDNELTFARNIKYYQNQRLNCTQALVMHLFIKKIDDTETQVELEKSIHHILKLNQCSIIEIEKFYIIDVLKLFHKLARYKFGTVKFWEKSLHLIESIIENQTYESIVNVTEKQKFIIHTMSIMIEKRFHAEIREKIINLLVANLQEYLWNVTYLVNLLLILKNGKIGQDRIWITVQKKFQLLAQFWLGRRRMKLNQLDKERGLNMQGNFRAGVKYFCVMRKGSFYFWQKMNELLPERIKSELLYKFKDSESENFIKMHFTLHESHESGDIENLSPQLK